MTLLHIEFTHEDVAPERALLLTRQALHEAYGAEPTTIFVLTNFLGWTITTIRFKPEGWYPDPDDTVVGIRNCYPDAARPRAWGWRWVEEAA